jgi:hypothetical protein
MHQNFKKCIKEKSAADFLAGGQKFTVAPDDPDGHTIKVR